MQFSSIGDLAQSLMLRRQNAALKSEMSSLTAEFASGKRQDIGKAVNGNFSALASVERRISIEDAYSAVRSNQGTKFDAIQNSFESIRSVIGGVGAELLTATGLGDQNTIDARMADIDASFDATIRYLNSEAGGEYLFSGANTNQPPLVSAEAILTELRPLAQAATDPADLFAQIDDWFNAAGSGFETIAYQGGPAVTTSIAIDETQVVSQPITADTPETRGLLRDLAIASLVEEGSTTLPRTENNEVIAGLGVRLNQAEGSLIQFQAQIGASQEKLETADARGEAQRLANFELHNSLTSRDPFDVASRLEEVQLQLESLYLLTARTSRLSLTEYLR